MLESQSTLLDIKMSESMSRLPVVSPLPISLQEAGELSKSQKKRMKKKASSARKAEAEENGHPSGNHSDNTQSPAWTIFCWLLA